jgi:hypothetical protein
MKVIRADGKSYARIQLSDADKKSLPEVKLRPLSSGTQQLLCSRESLAKSNADEGKIPLQAPKSGP